MNSPGNIRLAALDLDGTLLHDDKHISEYTLHTIKKLTDTGIIVVPTSGRNVSGMTKNILQVSSVRYAVCSNGAIVCDTKTGEIIHEAFISPDKALEMICYLETFPVVLYAHTNQGIIRSSRNISRQFEEKFSFIDFKSNTVPDLKQHLCIRPFKIFKLGVFAVEDSIFSELLRRGSCLPEISLMRTGDGIIELNSVHASKANGLAALCRHLDIPMSGVLAIGDNQNDISMLRQAGVSVAMGNAEEDVKEAAEYIAGTNEEDGAAKFLEEYFKI